MNPRSFIPLSAIFLLAACGEGQTRSGPGGVSAEDAKALDEAAAKLDAETAGQPFDNPEAAD